MFTDIVGFTSLMQENEAEAKSVRDLSEKIVGDAVREFGGETVQFYGDGVLSVFASAIAATRCAQAIQRLMNDVPNAGRGLCSGGG